MVITLNNMFAVWFSVKLKTRNQGCQPIVNYSNSLWYHWRSNNFFLFEKLVKKRSAYRNLLFKIKLNAQRSKVLCHIQNFKKMLAVPTTSVRAKYFRLRVSSFLNYMIVYLQTLWTNHFYLILLFFLFIKFVKDLSKAELPFCSSDTCICVLMD
jgi:hypothetical protein